MIIEPNLYFVSRITSLAISTQNQCKGGTAPLICDEEKCFMFVAVIFRASTQASHATETCRLKVNNWSA